MASVRYVCSECHSSLQADVTQRDDDGEMAWMVRYFCDECGHVPSDEGGAGLPSQDLRHRIIVADGKWRVVIEDEAVTEGAFVRLLQAAFLLRPASAPLLVESVPGIAFHGTQEECEMLERVLSREGAVARVERA